MVLTNIQLINELRKYSRDELRYIVEKAGYKLIGRTKEERINQIINKAYQKLFPPFDAIDKIGIEIVRQAYYSIKKRRDKVFDFIYNPVLSNDLYCHYENKQGILIGCKGANKFELVLMAFGKIIDPEEELGELSIICDKLKSLLNTKKKVYIFTHSLGGYIINRCLEEEDYPYYFVSYAPYAPSINSKFSNNKVKKHVYKKDIYSNNLIKIPNNCFVYEKKHLDFMVHYIKTYLHGDLNKDFIGVGIEIK